MHGWLRRRRVQQSDTSGSPLACQERGARAGVTPRRVMSCACSRRGCRRQVGKRHTRGKQAASKDLLACGRQGTADAQAVHIAKLVARAWPLLGFYAPHILFLRRRIVVAARRKHVIYFVPLPDA